MPCLSLVWACRAPQIMSRLISITRNNLAMRIVNGAFWLVFICQLSLFSPSANATEFIVTGTRIGGDGDRTRFVADLTQTVSFSVFVLADPYRVIIDLPEVSFDLPPGA